MTVNAEGFPVTAVGGIILVVAVLMVNREKMSIGVVEFPAATGTYQTVEGQGPFPVSLVGWSCLSFFQLSYHLFRRPGGFVPIFRSGSVDTAPPASISYL